MKNFQEIIQDLVCLNYNQDFAVVAEAVQVEFPESRLAIAEAKKQFEEIQKDLHNFEISA
jgi:hypothetical protein